MIKELIRDVSLDAITLSQALNRAKFISKRVKNGDFTKWIDKELKGYDYKDEELPEYRKITCTFTFTIRAFL